MGILGRLLLEAYGKFTPKLLAYKVFVKSLINKLNSRGDNGQP